MISQLSFLSERKIAARRDADAAVKTAVAVIVCIQMREILDGYFVFTSSANTWRLLPKFYVNDSELQHSQSSTIISGENERRLKFLPW